MFVYEKPGSSGVAARLPKNPGTQNVTPLSEASESRGTEAAAASASVATRRFRPAILRVIRCCDMTTPTRLLVRQFRQPLGSEYAFAKRIQKESFRVTIPTQGF